MIAVRRGLFLVLLVVVLIGPSLWAGRPLGTQVQGGVVPVGQTPVNQRDPAPPQVGTALILGQVVDAGTGEPLADAVVSPGRSGSPPTAPGAPAVNVFQSVITGVDGRFVFRSLPAGSYPVRATVPGYVPGTAGQGRPGGPDRLIGVADGQRLGDVTIRLWKYGSITGSVVDEVGDPATDLTVRAFRRLTVDGRPQLVSTSSQTARTDDRGRYRFSRLAPGDYVVVVPLTQSTLPTSTYDSLLQAVIADPVKPPEWAYDLLLSGGMQALQGSPARVGDVMWSTSYTATPPPSERGRSTSYRTTYYPSATSLTLASVIAVRSGEERSGIDLQLSLVPTVRVSGTVQGPAGPMANLAVRLQPAIADPTAAGSDVDGATAITRADGAFTFINIPTGQYVVKVLRNSPSETVMRVIRGEIGAASPTAPATPPTSAAPAMPTLFAEQPLTIGDSDVTGVSIMMREAPKVSGRVEFELKNPATLSQMQAGLGVMLMPLGGPPAAITLIATDPAMVDADGRFKTVGYAPDRYSIIFGRGGRGGASIKSITANGRDVTNAALELRDADVNDVVIKVSDRFASVTGSVHGPDASPAMTATVIAFPADYRGLLSSGLMSGRVQTVAATRTGSYAIGVLMPGDYLIAAIDDADVSDNQDAAFFDALARGATRMTVGDAEKKSQDLVLVKVKR